MLVAKGCCHCADLEGGAESQGQSKQPRYQLVKEQRGSIKADVSNKKTWDDLLATLRTVSDSLLSLSLSRLVCVLVAGWVPVTCARCILLHRLPRVGLPANHHFMWTQYMQGVPL